MKKLVFMFVAIAAISFASCGEQTKKTVDTIDSAVEANVDSAAAAIDSAAAAVDSAAQTVAAAVDSAVNG